MRKGGYEGLDIKPSEIKKIQEQAAKRVEQEHKEREKILDEIKRQKKFEEISRPSGMKKGEIAKAARSKK